MLEYLGTSERSKVVLALQNWSIRLLIAKAFFFGAAGVALLIWAVTN